VWRAHRSHAYQVAAAATSHPFVVKLIIALNAALTVLALVATWLATDRTAVVACTLLGLLAAGLLVLRFHMFAGSAVWNSAKSRAGQHLDQHSE